MTSHPLVLDEDGNTKPTYEQHPMYDGRSMDEAGRLVRTHFPIFECFYQIGKDQNDVEGQGEGIIQRSADGTFIRTFDLTAKDEAQIISDAVKQHALLHAGLWVHVFSGIKRHEDDMTLIRRDERVLQGEDEPDEMFARALPRDQGDPDMPF